MKDMLPILLWSCAAVPPVLICLMCAVNAHYIGGRRGNPVKPVAWSIFVLHILSLLFAMTPFIAYKTLADDMTDSMRTWYAQFGWPAGIVMILLVAAELLMMYLQAKRAADSEMDEALRRNPESRQS